MIKTPEVDFINAIRNAPDIVEAMRIYRTKHEMWKSDNTKV